VFWLTDGRVYLGPYGDEEPFAIMRGERTLRETHGAPEVWRVRATSREGAGARWRAEARRGTDGCVSGR
jgi:hypothetical protein